MNTRMRPRYYVSTPNTRVALYVDGYTSDDLRDWQLRMAPVVNEEVQIEVSRDVKPHDSFTEHELEWPDIDEEDIAEMTFMLGNVIRMCQAIPALSMHRGPVATCLS